jgi:hypothetical protein
MNFFKKRIKPRFDKNEDILKSIFNDNQLEFTEGEFRSETWTRSGKLLSNENRNDEVVTNCAGLMITYDIITKKYSLFIPPKFNINFFQNVKDYIFLNFHIVEYNTSGYVKTISFLDHI